MPSGMVTHHTTFVTLCYQSVSALPRHLMFDLSASRTGYFTLGNGALRGSNSRWRTRLFSSPKRPGRILGPRSLLFNENRDSFPGVKRPVCDADPSPPSSTEVKNEGSYTCTPPIRLHGVNRDYVYLLLTTMKQSPWDSVVFFFLGRGEYSKYIHM